MRHDDTVTMTNVASDTGATSVTSVTMGRVLPVPGLTWRLTMLSLFVSSAKTETSSVNTFIRYLKYANVDSSKESQGLFIFKLC